MATLRRRDCRESDSDSSTDRLSVKLRIKAMTSKEAGPKTITEYINASQKRLGRNCVKCARVFAHLHPGPRKA
jgi:hypothetical protein